MRARLLPLVALAALAVAACSESSPSQVRAADVYGTALHWFATQGLPADAEPRQVFVEPRGEGTAIALDVQADVVERAGDVTVTFVDGREEALQETDGDLAVRNDGVLVRLGPVVEDGDRVELEVDRWIGEDRFETLDFTLRRSGQTWSIVGEPVTTGSLEVPE